MILGWKSVAVAVGTALAAGMASAAGTTASSEPDPGTGVLGGVPHSSTTTSVFAIDEAEFMGLDADRDGRLSRQEIAGIPVLRQEWTSVDVDTDGYLSREELARYHAFGGATGAAGGGMAPDRNGRPSQAGGQPGGSAPR